MSNKDKTICTYACQNLNEYTRTNSSSGGIFSAIAEQILLEGGVVYGTAMSENCRNAEIVKITDVNELSKIRGSKYIQSENNGIFQEIKILLEQKNIILFSGTPCQVAGLKNYLGKEYNNLICCDVICHGVPSTKIWNKYVDYIEKKYKGKLSTVQFRCKNKKCNELGKLKDNNCYKTVFIDKNNDPFMQMFLKNYCLRPSCYNCKVKEKVSADVTLGDFWGADLITPQLNDGKGTSIAIIRSDKGYKLFDKVKYKLTVLEISYEEAVADNSTEYKSTLIPEQRDCFWKDANKLSFKKLYIKYIYPSMKLKIKLLLIKVKIWSVIEKVRGRRKNNSRKYMNYGLLFKIKR